jgi:hypothetical protein
MAIGPTATTLAHLKAVESNMLGRQHSGLDLR